MSREKRKVGNTAANLTNFQQIDFA